MKRIYLYLLFLICTVQNIVAQSNVAIHGESVNAAGRKIELLRMSDPISDYEILLDSIRIGENQKFELRCYTNYPMLVTLQIENYSQSFYVEPAREYNILIPQFDWNLDETKNVFLDPEPLPLVFRNIPPNDINYQIDSIDRFMARFINDNYFYFDQKFKPSVHYFDSLASELNKHCPDVDNDFVNRYKEYQLATLKYYLKYDTRKNLVNKYIKNHPILYNDENYMSLFAMIYANSISKGTRDISVHRLAYWVNNLDLDTYIDSIGMDPLLRHEQVRELAALQALKESYYNFRYYDGEMVIKMIEKLAAQSKFPDHKKIAKNLIYSLRHGDEESNQQELTSCKLIDVEKNP